GREVRRRDGDHGLELRALARLLARRAGGKVLDLQENDAGYVRAVHGPPACRLGRSLNRNNIRVEFPPLRSVASPPICRSASVQRERGSGSARRTTPHSTALAPETVRALFAFRSSDEDRF